MNAADRRAIGPAQKVDLAFYRTAPLLPDVQKYYDDLLSRCKELSDSARRSALLLLLIALAAELTSRSLLVDLELGPFKLTQTEDVRKVLPAIVAYFLYDTASISIRYLYSSRILTTIDRKYRPSLVDTRLSYLIRPATSSLFGPMPWHKSSTSEYTLITYFTLGLRVGAATVPWLLVASWYWRIFDAFGFGDVIAWLSAAASLGFLLFAFLLGHEAWKSGLVDRVSFGAVPAGE